ncbi:MAG: S1 RNA-binding domain-containing protein [Anaerolineae bacterium]|nr:S1 RNA-binding domain-containing protein [Anaerolineae bacterium]
MAVNNGDKPTSINDLKPKMALTGVVKKVELFGAFVDVGVGQDGLLHISQLSSERVRNVTDVVQEGQEVNVWVMNVDREKGRFSLTMLPPANLSWDEIKPGAVLTGKVERVERFGAFVNIGAERLGRIHVSELSSDYVRNPEDVVKVGDEVTVKVLKVDPQKRQIDLSIKALETPTANVVEEVEAENEHIPTAMELALRRAMQGTDLESELARQRNKKRKKSAAVSKQQEDILARTLQQRKR